jgi:transposase
VTVSNGKTTADGRQALYRKLEASDKVALEAGSLSFLTAKEIEAAVGCRVYVLNPHRLAVIYQSMKKTDKEDALKLAHILEDTREERLPEVPVPGEAEIRRRKILSAYRWAQGERNRAINRLHGLFVAMGITTVVKKDLATVEDRKEAIRALAGQEREEAEYLLPGLERHERRMAELEKRMEAEPEGDEAIERPQTAPGAGPKIAADFWSEAFTAYVKAERFENAARVGNYLGLVPKVYMSGDTVRYGRITKRGNGYLRAPLVQGAWAITRAKAGGALRKRYGYMTVEKGISRKKAVAASNRRFGARRLAELLYPLQKKGESYEVRKFAVKKREAAALAALAASV